MNAADAEAKSVAELHEWAATGLSSLHEQLALVESYGPLAVFSEYSPSRRCCKCKNSRCLKLYCDCFANGLHCTSCSCVSCRNTPAYEHVRAPVIQDVLERNPMAFRSKVATVMEEPDMWSSAPGSAVKRKPGCRCRRSKCLKRYCECFAAGIPCTPDCECVDCNNTGCQLSAHEHEAAATAPSPAPAPAPTPAPAPAPTPAPAPSVGAAARKLADNLLCTEELGMSASASAAGARMAATAWSEGAAERPNTAALLWLRALVDECESRVTGRAMRDSLSVSSSSASRRAGSRALRTAPSSGDEDDLGGAGESEGGESEYDVDDQGDE